MKTLNFFKGITFVLLMLFAIGVCWKSAEALQFLTGISAGVKIFFFVLLLIGAFANKIQPGTLYDLNVSALATQLVKQGREVIIQKVNEWRIEKDFEMYQNVKIPQALPKLSIDGEPRPYRAQKDTAGNDARFTDRVLSVFQSKWDFNFDPETYRNKYLAASGKQFDPNNMLFWQYLAEAITKKYLAKINDLTILNGVYDAAGSGAADLADGLVEILTNAGLTPISTGALTNANCVDKVELVAENAPEWMREEGSKIICSYPTIDKYKKHYRTLNGTGFDQNVKEIYLDKLDCLLTPRSWMKASQGLIMVPKNEHNLAFGTDGSSIAIHATPTLNTIDLRLMMPLGMQVGDTDAVFINDQL